MRTLAQYWPHVLGAVTFVAAILGLLAKWQTIKKNHREERSRAEEQQRSRAGIVFEDISVDSSNPYWIEWRPRGAQTAPSNLRIKCPSCKQFFSMGAVVSEADPSFEIILRNDGPRSSSILAIGVRVTLVAQYSYELPIAGEIEKAQKLPTSEAYAIEMPDIRSDVLQFDFDEDYPPVNVDLLVRKKCEPYILPPGGRFRYTLALEQYRGMPNNAIIRLRVELGEGTQESGDLYLRYGNTVSWL